MEMLELISVYMECVGTAVEIQNAFVRMAGVDLCVNTALEEHCLISLKVLLSMKNV